MLFSLFQTTLIVALAFFSSSLLEKKWAKNTILIFFATFTIFEVFALYSLGKFAGYEFYFHFNLNAIKGHGFQFIWQFLLGLIATIGLFFVLRHTSSRQIIKNKFYNILVSTIILFLLCLPGGVLDEKINLLKILHAKEQNIHTALERLGVPSAKYVFPDAVTATPGNNIVVISLESIEQGFLSNAFPGLTPNLNHLKQQWTYFDNINPTPGAGWTAGSIYCQLVGVPAFFKGQGNDFFQGSQSVKLTGLGHILNRAGYTTRYLIGNANFAGVGDILRAYSIPVVSQETTIGHYQKIRWGMHDYDLFQEAKMQIEQIKNKQPFAIFLSTLNTHFPNGIYDPRMKNFISRQGNQLEFSVASADYLVGDFLKFLKKKELLDRTTVFILPDHLLMGSGGSVIERLEASERRLYLLTNSTSPKLQKQKNKELLQIDLPRLILDGAEIKTNAKFLSDFLSRGNLIDYIKEHQANFCTLNSASLTRNNYLNGFWVSAEQNHLTFSSESTHNSITLPKTSAPFLVDLTFNEEMIFIEGKLFKANHKFSPHEYDYQFRRPHLVIKINHGVIEGVYFGDRLKNGVFKPGSKIRFDSDEIRRILAKNYDGETFPGATSNATSVSPERFKRYATDRKRFIAHAGGKIDGRTYTNSLEALNKSYEKGFRLFELDIQKTADGHYVATHDWQHWAKTTDYQGPLPPSRDIFLSHKIFNTYTPLDLKQINVWFKTHPDAILVTDKVNSPSDFAQKFIDRNRLMMELFSWQAVKEGQHAGIKSAMPTLTLINQLKGDSIQALKKLGVTDIPASRRKLQQNIKIFKELKANGINVYLFHVNFDKGIDESYVVCHDLDNAFGMYADSWDFNDEIDCSKK